jgi:hypothetical protein
MAGEQTSFGATGQTDKEPFTFDSRTVAKLHHFDDLDVDRTSHHHSLGVNSNQATPGPHNHDGTTSVQLLAGVTLTGSKAGNAALASVCAALATLGATDSTT